MYKFVFGFFFIIHILGDFYFQSDDLSEKKKVKYKYVLIHSLYYLLISVVCVIPFWSTSVVTIAVTLSVLHYSFDSIKYCYIKRNKLNTAVYVVDQTIHICCIAFVTSVFAYRGYELHLIPVISDYLLIIKVDPKVILLWIGLLLTVIKPANVTIKQLVAKYKPAERDTGSQKNAGAFIGALERIIILLLASAGQYSAIGLVLTAKSVARYDEISHDKKFAEYYLLGTLLSALFAISTYLVFV